MTNSTIRVKVKICGMTDPEQVRLAVDLGVDAIGMILHAKSPREINLAQAQAIREKVPAFVSLVGVFVDCAADTINTLAAQIGLDLVQLHGAESSQFADTLNTPYIKAIRAESAAQVASEVLNYPTSRALLLDPYVKGQHGGTGHKLDLDLWPVSNQKLILAGGLSAANVAAAVEQVQPWAVDLNSGVESAPGVKKIEFVEQALRALGR